MVFQSYALRRRLESRAGQPDVYTYEDIPQFLRHQIASAFGEAIGTLYRYTGYEMTSVSEANEIWTDLDQICSKNIWHYAQSRAKQEDPRLRFLNFLLNEPDIDEILSSVEFGALALAYADRSREKPRPENRGARCTGKAALSEINRRFIEHAVGYQIENGEVIRIDSTLVHTEIIKPALALLSAPMFKKANEDFHDGASPLSGE